MKVEALTIAFVLLQVIDSQGAFNGSITGQAKAETRTASNDWNLDSCETLIAFSPCFTM